MRQKLRRFVFLLAAAAALLVGARAPESEVAEAAQCSHWVHYCYPIHYQCYQSIDGTIYYCVQNYCYWNYEDYDCNPISLTLP